MLKFAAFFGMSLITATSFAKPCMLDDRSCLRLKNNTLSSAEIDCIGYSEVSAAKQSQGSTQLDPGANDGMGSPSSAEQLRCTITVGQTKSTFDFYNPYWGPLVEFNLLAEQYLEVRINDRWGSNNTFYAFKL